MWRVRVRLVPFWSPAIFAFDVVALFGLIAYGKRIAGAGSTWVCADRRCDRLAGATILGSQARLRHDPETRRRPSGTSMKSSSSVLATSV